MATGICPKCKSESIEKEMIRGSKTGDYKCLSCGYSDMPNNFKEAKEKNKK